MPPGKIRIIEDNRQVSSVIGPYDEGAQLSLNCIVTGGEMIWTFISFLSIVTLIATPTLVDPWPGTHSFVVVVISLFNVDGEDDDVTLIE